MAHQSDLRTLAQQGDANAIVQLLRQAIVFDPDVQLWIDLQGDGDSSGAHGIAAKQRIRVVLEAPGVPDQQRYAHQIYAAILYLEATDINAVHIEGRGVATQIPAWQQQWPLDYHLLTLRDANTRDANTRDGNIRDANTHDANIRDPGIAMSAALGTPVAEPVAPAPLPPVSPPISGETPGGAAHVSRAGMPETETDVREADVREADVRSTKPGDESPRYPTVKQSGLVALVAFALSLVGVLGFAMFQQRGNWPRLFARDRSPSPPTLPTPSPVDNTDAQSVTSTTVEPAITIKAVGDIIPGTDYPNWRLPGDPNYLFNSIQPFLTKEADIIFGNFESTLTDFPNSSKDISRGMTFAFRTPPAYADVLTSAGFDVLSVANNHSFDFGEPGFNDTIANIENAGMQAVGRKGQIVYVDEKGLRTAFIAFSYFDHHNTMHDLPAAQALIEEADRQADIVVVSVHAGAEGTDAIHTRDRTESFHGENRGNLVAFSHAVIDYGADLVLGHGPHVPRALELYKGRLVAYSLGNFLGHETLSVVSTLGTSMILQVGLGPEGDFVSGRVIPVALDPNGVPYLDDYFQSVILVRNLTAEDFPQTPLVIDDMGYILRDSFTQ